MREPCQAADSRAILELLTQMNERAAASAALRYTVTAKWDNDAKAWITDSGDVPGLAAQGDTFDSLADSVFALAPELLRGNSSVLLGTQITIIAERRATAIVTA